MTHSALLAERQASKTWTTRIHLVRHGQTKANLELVFPGPEAMLTREGVAQARRIGDEFARKRILVETILVSPTQRTIGSAENACLLLPVKPRIIVVQGLAEKDPGSAIGEKIPGSNEEIDRLMLRRGGETFPRFIERVENAAIGIIREIGSGKLGADVAIFGHSLANRIVLGVLQGIGGARGLQGQSQLNGGIKTLELERGV